MYSFETMLDAERTSIERFVKFRLNFQADVSDVLQEIYLTAYKKYPQLKNKQSFKAWIISIARNKCNDYFRKKANRLEIPIDEINETELTDSRFGASELFTVRETINLLNDKDKHILYLYYWNDASQSEIAKQLNVPLGTVKSRLHAARQNFKNLYRSDNLKGEQNMKKLPEFMPGYYIEVSNKAPFSVKWEELMGWFLVPKLGEKLCWGMYDMPSKKCSYVFDMKVVGKAKVHGIDGVELTAKEISCSDKKDVVYRTFVAQLTDTHCRYLATVRNDGDVRNYITFLDGDEFLCNWGFGEDNCGNETNLSPKGEILRKGAVITTANKNFLLDVVGRFTVKINGKSFDTVCVMDIETYNCGVVSEQYLDKNGRTVLWRRFNRDDWAIESYKKKWSEQLPNNERITVNGTTYVHWYDCITDYII